MRPIITALCALAVIIAADQKASAPDVVKVAIPQRGAWDAGLTDLGERGGMFKKHGLKLEILYVRPGRKRSRRDRRQHRHRRGGRSFRRRRHVLQGGSDPMIGSEMIGAPDLYWYVPANSPIKKIEDFNGKTVAFSLTGSSSHAALLALIAQYKLTAKPTSTGHHVDHHANDDRTGRCRLRCSAVRSRPRRGRQDPHHRDRQRRRLAAHASVRVNVTNVNLVKNRADVLRRFDPAIRKRSTGCIRIRPR